MAVDCNCEIEPGKGVSKDKKCTAVNSAPAAREPARKIVNAGHSSCA
jgi:hypothetical protein